MFIDRNKYISINNHLVKVQMEMTMPVSLRNKLKTLCDYGDGWSYAILWRFHQTNPM